MSVHLGRSMSILAVVACAGLLASCGGDSAAPPPPKYTITLTIPATTTAEGGVTVACTIDIDPAPDTGTSVDVALASDDTAAVVPATVTVTDTGTAGFNIITRADDDLYQGSVDAIITATGPDCAPDLGMITVTDNELGMVIVSIDSYAVEGDANLTTCTVLVYPALTSGTVDVSIGSGHGDVVVLSSPVTVDSSGPASFTLSFRADDTTFQDDVAAVITGTATGYQTGADTITLMDDKDGEITVSINGSTTVAEGSGVDADKGTVDVDAPYLADDTVVTVTLGSDAPAVALPETSVDVTIIGGFGTADFDITFADDGVYTPAGSITATITGTNTDYESVGAPATVTVTDDEFGRVTLTIPGGPYTEGNSSVTGNVAVLDPGMAGTTVTVYLESDETSAATVPASVGVALDGSGNGSGTFSISIRGDDALYMGDVTVNISSTNTGYENDSGSVDVYDDETGLITLYNLGGPHTEGATSVTGDVDVYAPAFASTTVTVYLESSDTDAATVPASVSVDLDEFGDGTYTFDITIRGDDALYFGPLSTTISSTNTGYENDSDSMDVDDDEVGYIVVSTSADVYEGDTPHASQVEVYWPGGGPGIVPVQLMSDMPTEADVPVLAIDVAVDAGGYGSAQFDVTVTRTNDGVYTSDEYVTITGMSAGYEDGVSGIDVWDDEAP